MKTESARQNIIDIADRGDAPREQSFRPVICHAAGWDERLLSFASCLSEADELNF